MQWKAFPALAPAWEHLSQLEGCKDLLRGCRASKTRRWKKTNTSVHNLTQGSHESACSLLHCLLSLYGGEAGLQPVTAYRSARVACMIVDFELLFQN